MEVFRSDVHHSPKNSKILQFFAPGGHKFDPSEKMTEIVSTGFLTIFQIPLAACLCDAQESS